jgi:hypothetical protein
VVWIAALAMLAAVQARAQDEAAPDSLQLSNPSAPPVTARAMARPIVISHLYAHDARSLNRFEPPKDEGVTYTGFQLQIGAAFTQQFQGLRHENNAQPNFGNPPGTVDLNQLISIGSGFNNADANLYLDAQLAKGMRVALTMYLSSRHHNETWVKDGYLLVDGMPWENETIDNLFKYLTFKVGHFEINYGDMHFRRTDNGEAMFNPLVGNLLMDAFTTEIGGEAYFRMKDWLAMAAVTGGDVHGQVTKPELRSPSYMGKLGWDHQFAPETRVRLTGSFYKTNKSPSNSLYSGSRAGSRYYFVTENTLATETANAWSGDVRPGFSNRIEAWVVNPFVKFHGLELFGNIEQAKGKAAAETSDRTFNQYAGEGVYRIIKNQLYAAARYNVATGKLQGIPQDVTIERMEAGGGWFLTQSLLAKIEYMRQNYQDFPATDIRAGAHFQGYMFEATVSF